MSWCTHPPREWFRGMLLPCADPKCGKVPGEALVIPLTSQGAGMRMKHERATFHRTWLFTSDGRRFAWELRGAVEDVTEMAEEAYREAMRRATRG